MPPRFYVSWVRSLGTRFSLALKARVEHNINYCAGHTAFARAERSSDGDHGTDEESYTRLRSLVEVVHDAVMYGYERVSAHRKLEP